MSNDKHPNHHFDDDLIAQLYDASKEEMQPSSDLDELILSTLHEPADANVADIAEGIDNKIVRLPLKKKRWVVPNSLVACLVVSVMVGLIYRENADKLLISDPTEFDYAIPTPSVERSAAKKSKISVLDAEFSAASDEVSVGFEEGKVQESQLLMDSASSFSELRSEVQGASARKAKKSKPKSMMRQAAPSRMLMMAPPIQAEDRTRDTINFEVEFSRIRTLRDEGDVSGARVLLDTLIAKYPSMELPVDLVLLKEGGDE